MKRSIVVLGAAGTVLLAACGGATSAHHAKSPTKAPSEQQAAPQATTPGSASTGASVIVKNDPMLGAILVSSDGRTLYQFEKDNGTTTACTGACANVWPSLMAGGAPQPGTGVDAARLSTAHGQVTYAGHLLYFFSGDHAPGDVNGLAIPDWSAVSPAGGRVSTKPDHT